MTTTFGPWHVHSYTNDSHAVLTDASGWEVAHCQKLENAILIAAAPDLLAALEALVADIDGCETEEDFIIMANGFAVEQARAALAGARGEGGEQT